MTLRYLLDTNVLSEAARPRPDPRLLRRLTRHADSCATAAPVVHELRYGICLLEPSARRLALARYLDDVVLQSYPVLPYDTAAAERHAAERARLARAGQTRPFVDGLIAAIAHVNGLVLVTEHVRDFQYYEDLAVESWKR